MNHINKKIINNKFGLLNLAEELNNISQACKLMGVSRDTFYRYKEAHFEPTAMLASIHGDQPVDFILKDLSTYMLITALPRCHLFQ